MISQTQNTNQTPYEGVSYKGKYMLVFLEGKKITLGLKEIEYLKKIMNANREVRPYDGSAFGWVANRYMRYHYKRLYSMEKKGLVSIQPENGHLVIRLTELGLKVIDILQNAE